MLHVYNSMPKKTESFQPLEDRKVILYVCGLTPYDRAHIGHARTYVAFDIIKRYLQKKGYLVYHIQNITDVDDKIIKRCRETGAEPKRLTAENHDEALALFDRLGIIRADVYPKVTEYIPEIIETIRKILKNGQAYETSTGVYFDVSKFKPYGALSGQKMEEIHAGSRKEIDETKDDPADFALWKKTKGELIEFDSPWGRGRPGWHIECSAMSMKYAKRTLDMHGGARDLIFPHHENEIAQSEAANAQKFVKYWLHTGFLTVNGEKMSKSLGNFITIADVLATHEPNAVRMFFALTHYRSPIDYNDDQIGASYESSERVLNALGLLRENLAGKVKKEKKDGGFRKESDAFMETIGSAMENDFDTPTALAALFNLIRVSNSHLNEKELDYPQLEKVKDAIEEFVWILGLTDKIADLSAKSASIGGLLDGLGGSSEGKSPEAMLDGLVALRDEFRKKKEYAKSDKVRNELARLGIVLEDDKGKTKWKAK